MLPGFLCGSAAFDIRAGERKTPPIAEAWHIFYEIVRIGTEQGLPPGLILWGAGIIGAIVYVNK